ncbi:sulfotransferase family 2 domain-containing protein [Profundibacter sp.]
MHRIPNTRIVFLHIPKTAGQAIKAAFSIRSSTNAHAYDTDRDKIFMSPKHIRFCVVRNPYDRFISAYRYNCFFAGEKSAGLPAMLNENKLTSDINDFINYTRKNKINLADYDHFKRQIRYVAAARPQIILRQENLDNDIQIIARLVGLENIVLPKKNRSSDRSQLDKINIELTDDNWDYINERYAEDYRLLGYRVKDRQTEAEVVLPAKAEVEIPVKAKVVTLEDVKDSQD